MNGGICGGSWLRLQTIPRAANCSCTRDAGYNDNGFHADTVKINLFLAQLKPDRRVINSSKSGC